MNICVVGMLQSMLGRIGGTLLCFGLHVSASHLQAEELRPNILLITADNLGYGDLRCYNPQSPIVTPRLDELARQGARLTNFYTASPTCTVSRACLMTGRIPERHRLLDQLAGLDGNYGIGLRHSEKLFPEYLKAGSVAYHTGCFGKWNIGFAEGSRPTERGFDEFLGHASGNIDYYHHRYNGKHDLFRGLKEIDADGQYSTDLFADAAIDFIQRHSAQQEPWFCYLPFNSPHFPNKRNKLPGQTFEWQAPDRAFSPYEFGPDEKDPYKRYQAVVTALDEAIGRVLDTLDKSGVSDQTFVFFYSDNGAFRLNRDGLDVGSNFPLRSGGVTCWEGGLRVVALARWPRMIEKEIVIDAPLWSPDLLPSCVQLAGGQVPADQVLDGANILPVLTEGAPSPHRSLYFNYRKHSALRQGDWKIVRESPSSPWQLFNLEEDPAEEHDLSTEFPQRLMALIQERERWEQSF